MKNTSIKVKDLLSTMELIGLTAPQVNAVRLKVWDCITTALKEKGVSNV